MCGISIMEFWDMTIGEILMVIKNYNKQEKNKAKEILAQNYNQAQLIAVFVSKSLDGKPIPSINEVFPNIFEEEKPVEEDKSWMLYKEQMLDFAKAHNKKRLNSKGG